MAMCVMAVVVCSAMPMLLTRCEPNHIARADFLDRTTPTFAHVPQPAVTIRVWPRGWACQAVRAPGSNVTFAPNHAGWSGRIEQGSTRTVPVKYSACPLLEGCEPLRLMSIF